MTPWWVSILAAFVGALVGFGVRTWWEEYRDFRAARRLVVSELRANSRALRVTRVPRNQSEEPTDPPVASGAAAKGQEDFPEVLTDVGFRGVQLVLARRLPSGLWNDLERVYSLLTPKVQEEPARLKKSKVMTGAILRNMDQASRQLNSYTFRNTVWPWRRGV